MYYTLITLFVFISTAFAYAYRCLRNSRNYFKNAGIPYIEPHWLFGSLKESLFMRKTLPQDFAELYRKLEPHRFAGYFSLFQPSIMIRDPELLKKILVKDFSYFQDHGIPTSKDELFGSNNLFFMEGDEWKNLRIRMTSTFTSGKMKIMFPLVKKCAEGIKPALMEYVSGADGLEIKDLCARYTTDVIASCAFGIDTQSLKHPDSEFRTMGKRIFDFRWQAVMRLFVPKIPKWFVELFGLHAMPKDVTDYFVKSVRDVVKYREQNTVNRGDFLDLLIALKNRTDTEKIEDPRESADLANFIQQAGAKRDTKDVEMTIDMIAAQCFLFFVGGFEGTSVTLSLLLFELAQNTDIQNKARQEITSNIEENGGEVTYGLLKKMTYLDMALKEILRMYPLNGSILFRKCNENYKIPESDVVVKKGTPVLIPMIAIQTDKKYFEKADEFYPEHFTKEAISKRHHFTYLPFGEGPRVCIAERFANMQMLMAAVYLIKDFTFEVSPKTVVPLEYTPFGGVLTVKGGIWLKCKPL